MISRNDKREIIVLLGQLTPEERAEFDQVFLELNSLVSNHGAVGILAFAIVGMKLEENMLAAADDSQRVTIRIVNNDAK